MNKTAIVFGANGYLGRHFCYYLKKNQVDFIPTGLSNKSIDGFENYIQIDIRNLKDLNKIQLNCDYIFIFSAKTGTLDSFKFQQDFIETNEIGLLNILNHYVETKSNARIIFPSTRLVYKGKKNKPLSENSLKNPLTIYAQTKLNGENFLKNYAEIFGVKYTIFRICVPYGNIFDFNFSYGTIGFLIKQAQENKKITIFGDGSLKRTFTYIEDLFNTIFLTLKKEKTLNQIYNIGSEDHLPLLTIANLIAKKFNVPIEYKEWSVDLLKIESGDTIFEDKKLKKISRYTNKMTIDKWIESLSEK